MDQSYQSRETPYFDLSLAQRWILKRVFELGWTIERFGYFDSYYIGLHGGEADKVERIGNTNGLPDYEFLAMLADNYQFRRGFLIIIMRIKISEPGRSIGEILIHPVY